jgi:DcaP outer membrane protein
MRFKHVRLTSHVLAIALMFVSAASNARAQSTQQSALSKTSMEIYGFAMLDFGHDFKTIDPAWFDTLRVTKLPSEGDNFGEDDNTFAGVRQSRFGVKTTTPTDHGDLKTIFEWELFGVGVDEGQTTIRLRHAYGELGAFGAGQYWSVFTDPDIFPNSLEYWGPTGIAWYRNVQFRWMPVRGDTHVTIAIERPGASGDSGVYRNRIELSDIKPRFPLPDLTGEVTFGKGWGWFRAAGIVRRISWDDTLPDAIDLSGDATGWGLNVTSGLKIKRDVVKLAVAYGEGIQNYMNDSPVDVGVETNFGDPARPLIGKALPIVGTAAFLDHVWSDRWTTSVGYSRQDIDNSNAQAGDAFKKGEYALANLLYTPVPNAMVGGELQWGRRKNLDGFQSEGFKLQFSFKYTFGYKLGG